MADKGSSSLWRVMTLCGPVEVWAQSESQARSRGKWKAAHMGMAFRNRAEEMTAVRECDVLEVREISKREE